MDSDSDAYMVESDFDDEDDFMGDSEDEVAFKPKAKPIISKKAASNKVDIKSVLSPKENRINAAPSTAKEGGTKGKTIEEIYQKKSQLEHILLRPDTYSEYFHTQQ